MRCDKLTGGFWVLLCMLAGHLGLANDIAFMRNGDVCVINDDGSELRKLARDPRYGLNRPVVWRPDGTAILFWSHDSPGWEIWQVTLADEQKSQLISAETGGVRSAVFSPDGSKIAYMRDAPNGLFVCNEDGSASKQLTNTGDRDEPPSWSPDSRRLAFESFITTAAGRTRSSIWVVDVDGSNLKRLTGGSQPVWCRGTNRIYFLDGQDGVRQVFSIDPDTSENQAAAKPVSSSNGDKYQVQVSADGRYLAYLVSRNAKWYLSVLDVEAGIECDVAKFGDQSGDFDWSPDGRRLVYATVQPDSAGIFVATVEGDQIASQRIADGPAEYLKWNQTRVPNRNR